MADQEGGHRADQHEGHVGLARLRSRQKTPLRRSAGAGRRSAAAAAAAATAAEARGGHGCGVRGRGLSAFPAAHANGDSNTGKKIRLIFNPK